MYSIKCKGSFKAAKWRKCAKMLGYLIFYSSIYANLIQ